LQNINELPQQCDDSPDLTGEELTQLLAELPEDFRVPLILFYFEDMSYRDIAAALGLPIGTIMSRLSRGKSHLRQRLTESVPSK
jgi:RNA polymerase sigma-70 factor (ECF subfamily)